MHESYTSIVDFGDKTRGPVVATRKVAQAASSDPCTGVICPPGLTCSGGACLDLSCAGVICPPGSTCAGGACSPVAQAPQSRSAPAPAAAAGPAAVALPGRAGTMRYVPSAQAQAMQPPATVTVTRSTPGPTVYVPGAGDDTSSPTPAAPDVSAPYVSSGPPWLLLALGLGAAALVFGGKP